MREATLNTELVKFQLFIIRLLLPTNSQKKADNKKEAWELLPISVQRYRQTPNNSDNQQ